MVITERRWVAIAKQSKLDTKCDTIMLSLINDLINIENEKIGVKQVMHTLFKPYIEKSLVILLMFQISTFIVNRFVHNLENSVY